MKISETIFLILFSTLLLNSCNSDDVKENLKESKNNSVDVLRNKKIMEQDKVDSLKREIHLLKLKQDSIKTINNL